MKIYRILEEERCRLESSIKEKTEYINNAPEGTLRCFKSRNKYKWYIVKKYYDENGWHRSRKYLSCEKIDLAEKLALKGLYEHEIADEKKELRAIDLYLNNRSEFESGNRYIGSVPEYSRLLGFSFRKNDKLNSTFIRNWLKDVSDENYMPEGRTFHTKAGIDVRSKTERQIANCLYDASIPFKYEQPIEIGSKRYIPDFTVMNPRTKRIYIWEHFGSMDDPAYSNRTFNKIRTYFNADYHPWENFLMTFEEKNNGIDDSWINAIIEHYLT